MYQKQITELVAEINQLAVEVTMSKLAIVFVRYSGHVDDLDLEICDKDDYKKKLYKESAKLEGDYFSLDRPKYEAKAIQSLLNMKSALEKFYAPAEFNKIWVTFQHLIEKEIVDCIKSGFVYEAETLFFDVELDTETKPLTLSDIYESLKLTRGEAVAQSFRSEMIENIKWLDNNIQGDGIKKEAI